jgi:ABC-type spermidine/putrescine transport system permease subunit II
MRVPHQHGAEAAVEVEILAAVLVPDVASPAPVFTAGSKLTYPLYVYGARRAAFPPQINVLATAILLTSLLVLGATVVWQQRTLRQRMGGLLHP